MTSGSIAECVRVAREQAELSQRDLAALLGSDHSWLNRVEAGKQIPTVDTLERIAKATGATFRATWDPKKGLTFSID